MPEQKPKRDGEGASRAPRRQPTRASQPLELSKPGDTKRPATAAPSAAARPAARPAAARPAPRRNDTQASAGNQQRRRPQHGAPRNNRGGRSGSTLTAKNQVTPEYHMPGVSPDKRAILQQKQAPDGTPPVRVYPLGGLEEIGRNCTVFECGDDIIIIDVGMMFPQEGMPGIDYIIPNISALKGKEKNIRGIILTHGHLDHVGGIALTIKRLGNPIIYTAPLTAGIVKKRQEEFGNANSLKIHLIKDEQKIQLGKHFAFEPFHVNHNISDAFGVALHTPYGTMLYTGDFKFDFTPVDEPPADLIHIASFGANGILAMFADSTDATSPGHQISESVVGRELEKIFVDHKGRLLLATFSSLLTRVQQIIRLCDKYDRKILVQGRSMNNNIELAHSLGYMKYPKGIFVEEKDFKRLPPHRQAIICTGAQGESRAALMRIASGEHRSIKLQPGDGVVFSSSVIPGNEVAVQNLKDTLVRHKAKIFHYKTMDIHAGGHAKAEDLKLMHRLTFPKYLIPIHGNRFMLEAHKELGIEAEIPEENIFVIDNGQVIEFDNNGGRVTEDKYDTSFVMVDGLGVGDVSDIVLRDRVALADEGMFVVIATVDKKTGRLAGSPDIISRGFVHMKENRELIEKTRAKVKEILKENDPKTPAFEDYLKNKIRNDIGSFLFHHTKRRPMILPVIIQV